MRLNFIGQLAELELQKLSWAEWNVLMLIGKWPVPADKVAHVCVSHSKDGAFPEVTPEQAKLAIASLVKRRWLVIVDRKHIRSVRSFVRDRKYLGPIYGFPQAGDVDFSTYGAKKFKSIEKRFVDAERDRNFAHSVKCGDRDQLWFKSRGTALASLKRWKIQNCVRWCSSIKAVGKWCVYWWEPYRRGYIIEFDFIGVPYDFDLE